MDQPEYNQYDYDPAYDDIPSESSPTTMGLPPSQLALIIGVNAVISLIIAVSVVLLSNRQVAVPLAATTPDDVVTEVGQLGQVTEVTASTVSSPTLQPTPLSEASYEVQAGDTLSSIATRFSVPLSDLMRANGLSNEDFIQIGQQLTIPLGGLPDVTPTFTPEPFPSETPLPFDPPTPLPADATTPPEPAVTVGPSPTPTITPTPSPSPIPTSTPAPFDDINIVVNEVIGAGDLSRETLVILNQGAGTSLRDWKLEGSSLGVFVFPDIFLFSGGSIRIHTAAGQNTASDLYLGQGEPAWPTGTSIILNDASNAEISRLVVGGGQVEEQSEPVEQPQ